MISWANRGEDMTTVDTCPSRKCMMGPYFLAKFLRFRWGAILSSRCMFPIIGSFGGPGGRFFGTLSAQKVKRIREETTMEKIVKSSIA
ncbi:hypothetical protein Hanom_Chr04g00361181 [Helianthus anomalus]